MSLSTSVCFSVTQSLFINMFISTTKLKRILLGHNTNTKQREREKERQCEEDGGGWRERKTERRTKGHGDSHRFKNINLEVAGDVNGVTGHIYYSLFLMSIYALNIKGIFNNNLNCLIIIIIKISSAFIQV